MAEQSRTHYIGMAALFLLVLVISTGCAPGQVVPESSLQTFSTFLDERVPVLMNRYGIPGVSMALIQDGQLVWSNAYGYADVEHERQMTVDAVCRAESISKSFTAWGVLRLVEQGLIDLDAPVQKYLDDWVLPETAYDTNAVTIRRLLSNNAGMPPGTIGEEYPPGSELPSLDAHLTKEASLIREPGTGFLYSNPGFNLLELLVEEVTNRDFADYMADEVLIPLGMQDAGFTWRDAYQGSIPMGYEMQGDPVPPYVYPARASGGLFANVKDLARFVSYAGVGDAAKEQTVLSQESIRKLYEPQVDIPGLFGFVADAYGFGHFIETLPDGRKAVWHGGQGHGWMTHFHTVPQSGDGIVILTNSQRSWPFIAEILIDWAQWCGFGSVKFGIISQAAKLLQAFTGLLGMISIWQGARLLWGLLTSKRRFTPPALVSHPWIVLQIGLGLSIITALTWAAAQPYLFVTSIFPGTIQWTAVSLLSLAVLMILSAIFLDVDVIEEGESRV